MKFVFVSILAVAFAIVSTGCDAASNTNLTVNKNTNSDIIVTNTNTAPPANTRTERDEITKEDFEKDKAKYEKEAREAKSTIGQGAEDLWLWVKTRSVLLAEDDLRESTINVDVENAVVTLKGTVGTKEQKEQAVKATKEIEGVKSVKDMLKVAPADSAANLSTDSDKKDEKK